MTSTYDVKHIKVRALHDNIIVTDMHFDEVKTKSGIVLRSDDGKTHGIHPRWGKIYNVGPAQKELKVGQWILVEHGRWTRGVKIHDGEGEKTIRKVDLNCILAVSDEEPTAEDQYIGESL